ncbi:MAG: radical SAM protein [Myxococcales bacterium]
MRLLCVPNPHVRLGRAWAFPYVPYELLSAMASAEDAGAEAALFDVNRLIQHGSLEVGRGLWDDAARLLAEAEPDAVLFETWTGTLHHTLLLARAARARLPGIPLVLGGCATSAMAPEVRQRFPFVDAVLCGDLEPGARALARAEPLPSPLERACVPDLDALPRVRFEQALLAPGDAIPLETGRGCSQACSFCALAGHWSSTYRSREPEGVAREMSALAERYPGSPFDLTQDAVFFDDPERLARLCRALDGRGLGWTCHARADRLGPEQLDALRGAGCKGILFGVESGCPRIQERCGKRVHLEKVRATVAQAIERGIEARVSFVVGFPEEDLASLKRTFELTRTLRLEGAADVAVQPLRAFPGSPVHTRHRDELVFEPMLCAAAEEDEEARALIAAMPALFSTSYRVPSPLTRDQTLGAWLAMTALGRALNQVPDAFDRVLAAAKDLPDEIGDAVARLAAALASAPCEGIDPRSWKDLLAYERAVFEVGRAQALEGARPDAEAIAACMTRPETVRPRLAVPCRLVQVATPLERLVAGDLRATAAEHEEPYAVLVAKLETVGQASFYTRRSFAVETFRVDPSAPEVLALCQGEMDVRSIGLALAAVHRSPPHEAVESAVSLVTGLAQEGVLQLEVVRSLRDAKDAP